MTPPVSDRRRASVKTPAFSVESETYAELPLSELLVTVAARPAVLVAPPAGARALKSRREPVEVAAAAFDR